MNTERIPSVLRTRNALWWAISVVVGFAVLTYARNSDELWAVQNGGTFDNLRVARVLLLGSTILLTRGAFALAPRMNRARWILVGVWALYALLLTVIGWPGYAMTDTAQIIFEGRQLINSGWYSWLYGEGIIALLDLSPHMYLMTLCQALGTAAVFAYAGDVILRRSGGVKWPVVLTTVLLMVSAPTMVNILLVTRDSIFGALHVLLALLIYDAVAIRKRATPMILVGVAVLVAGLSTLRGDGIVLLAAPLLLLALKPPRLKALLTAAGVLGAFLALNVGVKSFVTVSQPEHRYEISLRISAISAIINDDRSSKRQGVTPEEKAMFGGEGALQRRFWSRTPEADEKALSRVFDLAKLDRFYTPYEIPAFWTGGYNDWVSDPEWKRFKEVSDRLIKDNIGVVASSKLVTFVSASGMSLNGFTGIPVGPPSDRFKELIGTGKDVAIVATSPVPGIQESLEDYFRSTAEFRGIAPRGSAIFWNLVPAILLMLVPLLVQRRLRYESIVSLIILSRVPLLFLAAPAAQFKYYLSVYIAGIVILGLMLASWIAGRRDPRGESSPEVDGTAAPATVASPEAHAAADATAPQPSAT